MQVIPDTVAALMEIERMDAAVGLLVERRGWSTQEATLRLHTAARRSGTSPDQIATAVLARYAPS
jgi:AmiR/NasT family two-component response regulator